MSQQTDLASTGSRLLSGNSRLATQIESEACAFWNAEAALIAISGYEANVSIFSTLPGPDDTVLYDELVHASVHVGLKQSRCRYRAFRHNDVNHLSDLLRTSSGTVFVAVESVYSMDGDLAPLREISDAMRDFPDAHLIVDEAHATGVFGRSGRGLVDQLFVTPFLRLHTFGKGAGGTGAVILCDETVKLYLLNYAKGLIYSTFPSVPALCLMRASLHILASGETQTLQAELWDLIAYAQQKLRVRISSPIIPIITPDVLSLSKFLEGRGIRVMPVRYPTVPKGKDRIRICLRADMTRHDIDELAKALDAWNVDYTAKL